MYSLPLALSGGEESSSSSSSSVSSLSEEETDEVGDRLVVEVLVTMLLGEVTMLGEEPKLGASSSSGVLLLFKGLLMETKRWFGWSSVRVWSVNSAGGRGGGMDVKAGVMAVVVVVGVVVGTGEVGFK